MAAHRRQTKNQKFKIQNSTYTNKAKTKEKFVLHKILKNDGFGWSTHTILDDRSTPATATVNISMPAPNISTPRLKNRNI